MKHFVRMTVAALVVFAFAGRASALDHIKVSYPNLNGSFIYFFTAIQKNYYKDEGFDLEVLETGGGPATAALVSGDLQFSTSGSSAISAIMKGAKLKVLLVGEDRPDWQVWSTQVRASTNSRISKGSRSASSAAATPARSASAITS